MKYLERKYFNQTDTCGKDLKADSSPLYISDVWAVFVILGIGLITSTVCLVVEVLRARIKPKLFPRRTQA